MSTGVVTTITTDWRGDTLAAAVDDADTTIAVESAIDFDENGGWLVIGDSAPIAYLSADDDTDLIVLATAAGADYEAGLPVDIWDPTVANGGSRVVEYVATVELSDGTGSPGAVIPHNLITTSGVDYLIGASVPLVQGTDGGCEIGNPFGREPILDGEYIDRIAIGQTPSASLVETFSGTSLPAGWTTTKTGITGTGSGSVLVPGASVVSSGTPTGSSGSVLLIDYGAAGLTDADGQAAGEVFTPLPDATNARIQVRFRIEVEGGIFGLIDQARLTVRRSDGAAWSGTEDSVSLGLIGTGDFFGETFAFPVYVTTNGSDALIGNVVVPTSPADTYHYAELEVSAGVVSARVWDASTTRPDWMLSMSYTGVATAGKASLIWSQHSTATPSRGQLLWVDSLDITNYEEGFYVDELGGGDWSDLRRRIMADVSSMIPHVEAGAVASGTLVAGTPEDVAVTFAQPFDSVPAVVVGMVGTVSPSGLYVAAANITTTGFNLRFERDSGTSGFTGHWHAAPRTV